MRQYKKTTNKQLGQLLIERGVITHDQIETAISTQKEKGGLIGELLVELKFATEKDIAQALTCQYGFPYLPLLSYEIDTEVLASVPEDMCLKNCVIPIDRIGKSLTVAMANPLNFNVAIEIEQLTECTIQIFVSTPTDIKKSIAKYYTP
ncbi:MAG: type IV pilus assembly protein PilB [Lysobacterales bacterium]|jgi:type IV pilus assembly protein PilB